jgi:hypothetical protein
MTTAHFTEENAIVGAIDPQTLNDGSLVSEWVDMAKYRQVAFIVAVGATDTTVDAKLQYATDNQGTGANDITGKAVTQLTAAAGDNKQVVIEIAAEDMPADSGYCALVVVAGSGSTGAVVGAVGIGTVARYAPVSHISSVAEVKL